AAARRRPTEHIVRRSMRPESSSSNPCAGAIDWPLVAQKELLSPPRRERGDKGPRIQGLFVLVVAELHRDLMSGGEGVSAVRNIELPFVEHAARGGKIEQQMAAGSLHFRARGMTVGIQGHVDED